MLKTLRRIIKLSGKYKNRVYWGLICSILNSVFNSFSVFAFLWVLIHIDNLSMEIIWQTVEILVAGLIGKIILKFLTNMFMTAAGYIIFTDKRLELGDKLKNQYIEAKTECQRYGANNSVFDQLPATFTKEDLRGKKKGFCAEASLYAIISRWKHDGWIEKIDTTHWKKTLQSNNPTILQ